MTILSPWSRTTFSDLARSRCLVESPLWFKASCRRMLQVWMQFMNWIWYLFILFAINHLAKISKPLLQFFTARSWVWWPDQTIPFTRWSHQELVSDADRIRELLLVFVTRLQAAEECHISCDFFPFSIRLRESYIRSICRWKGDFQR